MYCAPRHVFGGMDGVGFRFHVSLPESFSAFPRALGPVFMFYAPGLIFGGPEGVESHFHVLHSLTRFRRCEGRRSPFSCFALPDSFFAVPRASGLVFMLCSPGYVFGHSKGDGSRFQDLRSRTRFGDTEGVGSRFLVLCSRNRFRRF
jgi:hypothetical protein